MTKSFRQRHLTPTSVYLAYILLISLTQAVLPDEGHCVSDPSTGEEQCRSTANDAKVDDENREQSHAPYVALDDDDDDANTEENDWSKCTERHNDCPRLASKGECDTNPGFMHFQCPQSCNLCAQFHAANGEICTDNDPQCQEWTSWGECGNNPDYMHFGCRRSCLRCVVDANQFGIGQYLPPKDSEHHDKTKKHIDESIQYMAKLWSDPNNNRFNYKCRNTDSHCSLWAAQGKCSTKEKVMNLNCAPVCQTCHLLDDEDDDDDQDLVEDDGEGTEEGSNCKDFHKECTNLAAEEECEKNPNFMEFKCPKSCDTCEEYEEAKQDGERLCTDTDPSCKSWAASGECRFNPRYMHVSCRRSCLKCFVDTNQFGKTQALPDEDSELYDTTQEIIDESIEYIMDLWSSSNPDNDRVNYKCRNMNAECSLWAAEGDCEENEDYMHVNCAPACKTCDKLDIRLKCPITDDNKMVYQPGDLNALMERIVDDADGKGTYLKYKPEAISRPRLKADGTPAPGVEIDGPWIVRFENFLTQTEAEALIAAGAKKGYERSADVGEENPDGSHEESVNEDRTSMNAWCDPTLCNEDPIIGPVIERISTVTETPVSNSEHLQLLRYEPGQFYRKHHDYIEYQQELPCGPRALTMFLYLNDVDEGGGTHFPLLDITVQPKMGSAILWPSVTDQEPEVKDPRTDHEALEVIKGIKYGANAWIHTRDYWKAEDMDCT